jgi:anti-sigma regulatory factor (Ser/Thr protein kinase)
VGSAETEQSEWQGYIPKSDESTRILKVTVPAAPTLTKPAAKVVVDFCEAYKYRAGECPEGWDDRIFRFDCALRELLQNAFEWGESEVYIKIRFFHAGVAFYIKDDGPGFDFWNTLAKQKEADPLRGDHYGLLMASRLLTTLRAFRPKDGGMVLTGFMSLVDGLVDD